MEATASTRRPSMWNSSSQYRALAIRKLRTSLRPKLNTSEPQSGCSLPGVLVLVQGGAVEAGQGEGVLGEVRRHPVDQHPDAPLVQPSIR